MIPVERGRTLKRHVSQLRQILDVQTSVEQDRATGRLLDNLDAEVPDGSLAWVMLKLGRAELRKYGLALQEEGPERTHRRS